MPLGNGDIGVNAWMEPDGALVFYISKTDSWSDNGRLLKVGRLRITTEPPLSTAGAFEQRLDLDTGALLIACGEGSDQARLRLWVDAHHPEIHVTIDGESERTATAEIDLWRTERTPYPRCEVSDLLEDRSKPDQRHEPIFVEADTILQDLEERVGWYHYNRKSVGPALTARLQGLEEYFEDKPDPLLHRIFGAVVSAPGGKRVSATQLSTPASQNNRFRIVVRTEHPSTPERWLKNLDEASASVDRIPFEQRQASHEAWWQEFWNRSWIHVTQKASDVRVPRNEQPLRIAEDQDGSHRFVGELGRVTITRRAASAEEIKQLAGTRDAIARSIFPSPLFVATQAARRGPLEDSAHWEFPGGLTLEAWIKTDELPGAGCRIIDKITPGTSDGLLLDTYPGNGLRFIVGSSILQANDVLPTGRWVHVAATVDTASGERALYVNGILVAAEGGQELDDASTVSRAYALQRWIDACAARGAFPIKFNGSIFTVSHEGKFGDADYRRWGPGYWWQNTRLPYLSMCASGDAEMMRPLFRMYAEQLMALHEFRTRAYTGHGGAFIPECIYFWGPTFTATYGWTPFAERGEDKFQESPWHKWEWVSGLELVWMMLDYADHTEDEAFVREVLLPASHPILTFFEEQATRDEHGKLVLRPSQALETWWDCTNPMPEIAGLRAILPRLVALPEELSSAEDRALWSRLQAATPELPLREEDGLAMLAPAARFEAKSNVENPELYAVFPFRLVSFEKDNVALGLRALENRWDRGAFGWRQDDLFMTHLGLAEEARANLVRRARNTDPGSRFPAFWGPNYDWVPDQDHGGVLMRTLQTMLMQTEGREIHLLPAWPRDWDVSFKLHAPYQTTITGRVQEGRLIHLEVAPKSRFKNVVIH